jgi:hypothetical protein
MRNIAILGPLYQRVRGFAGGHDHAAASSIGMPTFKGESRHAVSVFSAQWTPQALLETASQRLQGAHDEALLGLQGRLRREVDPRPERYADDREEDRRLLKDDFWSTSTADARRKEAEERRRLFQVVKEEEAGPGKPEDADAR